MCERVVSSCNDVVNKLPWCFMHLHDFQPMAASEKVGKEERKVDEMNA